MKCSLCGANESSEILDLGSQPLANRLELNKSASLAARRYDLSLVMCEHCLYVHIGSLVSSEELFRSNLYLSGVSVETTSDLESLAEDAIETCKLKRGDRVIDVASNDGTLLAFFRDRGMTTIGIDPSKPAAEVATQKGLKVVSEFLNRRTSDYVLSSFGRADLITMANVITHVEDPKATLQCAMSLLNPDGSIVMEFYNFESIIRNVAFDQVYHEHVSYFDFTTFLTLLRVAGLEAFKVLKVKSQGGSLRVFAGFPGTHNVDVSVERLSAEEGSLQDVRRRFQSFRASVDKAREDINRVLSDERLRGRRVYGYGASAKATVLINFLGLDASTITAIGDGNPLKQGKFVPGTDIPIITQDELRSASPDLVVIFSWNLRQELRSYLTQLLGARVAFLALVPQVEYLDRNSVNSGSSGFRVGDSGVP